MLDARIHSPGWVPVWGSEPVDATDDDSNSSGPDNDGSSAGQGSHAYELTIRYTRVVLIMFLILIELMQYRLVNYEPTNNTELVRVQTLLLITMNNQLAHRLK